MNEPDPASETSESASIFPESYTDRRQSERILDPEERRTRALEHMADDLSAMCTILRRILNKLK